jgi:hypothetical protein
MVSFYDFLLYVLCKKIVFVYMVLLGLLLDSSVVVGLVGGAAHGSILVAGAALARHWSVQRRVQVRRRVRPGIPNRVRHVENKN